MMGKAVFMDNINNSNILRRISYIVNRINEVGKVSKKDIAKEFNVSIRTVTEDIARLRDMGALIDPSKQDKGYYIFTKPFNYYDFSDERLLVNYSLINNLMNSSLFIPYISKSLLKEIKDVLSKDYSDMAGKFCYQMSSYEDIRQDYFRKIIESFKRKRKLLIDYIDLNGDKTTSRIIEPFKIINYFGCWYLVAYCYIRMDIRNFRISRIQSINVTDNIFETPVSEEFVDNSIKAGFGIYIGHDDEVFPVKIRFYNQAYYSVQNQIFHKDQKLTKGKDEKFGVFIDVELNVICYDEIIMKILQYGENAEALYPEDFRERWKMTIQTMYERFVK